MNKPQRVIKKYPNRRLYDTANSGYITLADVKQATGTDGEPTNDEKPGLTPGNKFVWKEDNKKLYVSFGPDGKANGVAWEGFAGK